MCGWQGLRRDPRLATVETCICCGYCFGVDDLLNGHSFAAYRASWLARGMPWLLPARRPAGWEAGAQLRWAGAIGWEASPRMPAGHVSPAPEAAGDFRAVSFRDAARGYVAGGGGCVLATDDGGHSWRARLLPLVGYLYALACPSPRVALAGGSSRDAPLFRSADAGASWEPATGDLVGSPVAAAFPTAEIGFVAGSRGLILKTADAGLTWRELRSGTLAALGAAAFWTERRGLVAGTRGTMLRTDDGGTNWHQLALGVAGGSVCMALAVVGRAAYAGTDEGLLLRTVDDGASWAALDLLSGRPVRALAFPTEGVGLAATDGALARTVDGGATWRVEELGPGVTPTALSFPTEEVGFAVGNGGMLLKTTDAGASWQRQLIDVQALLAAGSAREDRQQAPREG